MPRRRENRARSSVLAVFLAGCVLATVLAFVLPHAPAVPPAVDDAARTPASEEEAQDAGSDETPAAAFDPDAAWLPDDMDPELADALRTAARDDADARFALEHAADYARFGAEYRTQLLELAAEEPTARPFVAQVLGAYPSAASAGLDDGELHAGGEGAARVPRLFQWNVRWGFVEYSAGPLGVTGCCPTALSMVCAALSDGAGRSPADLASLAVERGYVSEADGTYAEFLPAVAPELGLACEVLPSTADGIRAGLQRGAVLICDVGPGEFTDGGHFFVITGANADGTVSINDPYSAARSDRAWDPERLAAQSIGLYAFWSAS